MDQNTLEAKMKEKPLTREKLLSFLRNEVEYVAADLPEKGAHLIKHGGKYRISIGFLYSRSEQEISLIHEISHVVYEAMDWIHNPHKQEMENLIELESRRFYEENTEFVRDLYAKLTDNEISPGDL